MLTWSKGSSAAAALRAAEAAATTLVGELECSRLRLPKLEALVVLPKIKLPAPDPKMPPFCDACRACNACAVVLVNCRGETR